MSTAEATRQEAGETVRGLIDEIRLVADGDEREHPVKAACFNRGNSRRESDRGSGRLRGVSVETTLSLRSLSMIRERIAGIAVAGVTNS